MLPVKEISLKLKLNNIQETLFHKYENLIKEQHHLGIVDPLKVFLYLFDQYCMIGGFRVPIAIVFIEHADFLKNVDIKSMEQMLHHLNNYWCKAYINANKDFYAMCFAFFYYYGIPHSQYEHLQPLAQSVLNKIMLEAEDAQHFMQQQNHKNIKFNYTDQCIRIFQLKKDRTDSIKRFLIEYIQPNSMNSPTFILQESNDAMSNLRSAIRLAFQDFNEDIQLKIINECLEALDYSNKLTVFDASIILQSVLLPENIQMQVIVKILMKYQSMELDTLNPLFEIFSYAKFNVQSRIFLLNQLLDILDNCHYESAICEIVFNTLTQMDLNECDGERLVKTLMSFPPHSNIIDIITKIAIPEILQNTLMQHIFENVDEANKSLYQQLIQQVFPRFTIAQQLFWRTKIIDKSILDSYWVKYGYRISSFTVIQLLNDIQILQAPDDIKDDLHKAIKSNDMIAVDAILNSMIAKKYPTLVDDALAYSVINYRNFSIYRTNLIEKILARKPNLNFVYKGRSLLQWASLNAAYGTEIAKKLILAGANVNFRCPLHVAVYNRNSELVKLYLEKCLDQSVIYGFKLACEYKLFSLITLFIHYQFMSNKLNVDSKILLIKFALMNLLYISNQNEINGANNPDFIRKKQEHQLWYAGCRQHEKGNFFLTSISVEHEWNDILLNLINSIPIYRCNIMFNEMLLYCNKNKMIKFAEILVNFGANITLVDLSIIVSSALLTAKLWINLTVLNEFFYHTRAYEVLFAIVDKENFGNILDLANMLEMKVNTQDMHGKTLLHHICEGKNIPNIKDRIRLTKRLLANGADLFIKDKQQFLPEDYIYSDGLFAHKSDAERTIAQDCRREWKDKISNNYQNQLLTKKIQFFIRDKQQQDTQSKLARLQTDHMKMIFSHMGVKETYEDNQQVIDEKFRQSLRTLSGLTNK